MESGRIFKRNHDSAYEGNMGFLDELKKKTEQQLILEQAARQRAEKLEEDYRVRLLPAMEKTYTYLHEMCQHLNYINTDTLVSYELAGIGELEHLRQEEYKLKADSRDNMQEIILSFDCQGENDISVTIENRQELEKLEQYLFSHHLRFQLKTFKDDKGRINGGKFIIQKHVPVAIKFKLDVEKSAIDFILVNLEQLGRKEVQFSPESISEEFLDKLAKYIVRESDSLFKLDISETERKRIRAKLLHEKHQRESELLAADKKPSDDVVASKKRLFTRILGK